MTTNQEGVHLAVRDITGTARSYNEDWHALFDSESIAAGTFNERMLAWINATLSTSYTNVSEAMQAFAVEQGFANWSSMNTFVAGSDASSFLSDYGPYGMVLNFQDDASIAIKDETATLDFRSDGQVSNGALVGPGAKLTNLAPSPKLTEQSDGLLKFQAHNIFTWSEDFSNAAWAVLNCTKSGTTEATITLNAGTTAKLVGQSTTFVNGASGVFSIEAKAGTHTVVQLWNVSLATAFANFDVSTGTIGTVGAGVTANMVATSDGYYKCSVEWPTATGAICRVYGVTSTTSAAGASTASTGTYQLRKPHLRRAPSLPDYIATTTAAAYDLPYVYSGGVRTGIMVEPAATNLALRSNDFTNASWTKSNMTTALTATGPDGIANSASTLTATAGNATALQAITSASSNRVTSVYIKRRTGSGNIDLTQDNGSTWTTQAVTSSWTRVALAPVTLANPTVGIRIVTSGDEVDAFCFDHETGTVATSPIITYGAAVARVADQPTALLSLFPSIGTAYTVYAKYKPQSASIATTAMQLDNTTSNELVSLGNDASAQGLATITDGGVSQASITSGTITSAAFHRIAASVEADNVRLVVNGGAEIQDTSVTLPTLTRLLLGTGQELQQVAILPGARTEAQLQALGA